MTAADLLTVAALFAGQALGSYVAGRKNLGQLRKAVAGLADRTEALEEASEHRDQRDGRAPSFLALARQRIAAGAGR